MGVSDGSFDELQSIWNVCGPIVGGVFGHYFGGTGKKDGSDARTPLVSPEDFMTRSATASVGVIRVNAL